MDKGPDEIYCPNCAKPIVKEAVICPHCRFQIKKLNMPNENIILKAYWKTSTGANYLFNADIGVLASYIQQFFKDEGYELQEGTPVNGSYLKGSLGMRLMFGGFAERYKFTVNISEKDGMAYMVLSKGMSGASGGLIGYNKMEKEITRIREKIYNNFLQR